MDDNLKQKRVLVVGMARSASQRRNSYARWAQPLC